MIQGYFNSFTHGVAYFEKYFAEGLIVPNVMFAPVQSHT